eukprot:275233_1
MGKCYSSSLEDDGIHTNVNNSITNNNNNSKNQPVVENKEILNEQISNKYKADDLVFFDKSSPFKCIKHIDQKTKNIVFGFINQTQQIASMHIPELIRYWCLLYYYEPCFNNLFIGMKGEIIAVHTSIHHANLHANGNIIEREAKFTLNSLEIKTKPTDHCHYIEIKQNTNQECGYIDIESTNLYQPTKYRFQNEKRIQLFEETVDKNVIDITQYPKNKIVSKFGASCFGSYQRIRSKKDYSKLRRNDEIYLIAPSIDELRFGDIICVFSPLLNSLTWIECKHTTYLRDIPDDKATDIMGRVTSVYGATIHANINPSIYIGRYKATETFRLMSFKARMHKEFNHIYVQVKSTSLQTNYPDQVVWISVKATNIDISLLEIE